MKWTLVLTEFCSKYVPQKAIKGQALADFLVDHLSVEIKETILPSMEVGNSGLLHWTLIFNASKIKNCARARIIIISPSQLVTHFSLKLDFECSNNQAKYEALIIGLETLLDLGALVVKIKGDS